MITWVYTARVHPYSTYATGGEGEKSAILRTRHAKNGHFCVREGRGVKNGDFLRTYYMDEPLIDLMDQ